MSTFPSGVLLLKVYIEGDHIALRQSLEVRNPKLRGFLGVVDIEELGDQVEDVALALIDLELHNVFVPPRVVLYLGIHCHLPVLLACRSDALVHFALQFLHLLVFDQSLHLLLRNEGMQGEACSHCEEAFGESRAGGQAREGEAGEGQEGDKFERLVH